MKDQIFTSIVTVLNHIKTISLHLTLNVPTIKFSCLNRRIVTMIFISANSKDGATVLKGETLVRILKQSNAFIIVVGETSLEGMTFHLPQLEHLNWRD